MKLKILDIFNLKKKKGEVGVEVEFECTTPDFPSCEGWNRTPDGSLRGHSMEYNLGAPQTPDRSKELTTNLYGRLLQSTRIVDSPRAGVHVHVNVQTMNEEEVMKFILLYLLLEILLVRWCGEARVGNMYCLRLKDAEGLTQRLLDIIENRTFRGMLSTDIRYASVNLDALHKFGSLEFRALQTPLQPVRIHTWIDLLLKVRDAVPLFTNPTDIVEGFSADGAEPFLRGIFGDLYDEIAYDGMEDDLYEGARIIQPIAYEEWRFLSEKKAPPASPALPEASIPVGVSLSPGSLYRVIDVPARPRRRFNSTYSRNLDQGVRVNPNANVSFYEGIDDV